MTDEIPPGWLSQLANHSLWPRSLTGGWPMPATTSPMAMGPPDDLWQQKRPAWMDRVAEPASNRGILGDLSLPAGQSGADPWRDAMSQAEEARRAAAERLQRSVLRLGPPAEPLTPQPPAAEHLDSGGYWGAERASPGRDERSPAHGFYLAPVPRAPSWEQVVPTATSWSVSPKLPSPTSWGDPDRGPECYTTDGKLSCTTPGGRRIVVPAENLPDRLRIAPDDPDYHSYNVPVPAGGSLGRQGSVMPGVIDDPTPGPAGGVRPATPEGTVNPAAPGFAYVLDRIPFLSRWIGMQPPWPVRSYRTTDQDGRPVVVNVTQPSHLLYPGVVMRYETTSPSEATIQNEGTGLAPVQGPRSFVPEWARDRLNDYGLAIAIQRYYLWH